MSTSTPTPEWVDHAIWWQVYPLGFVGAEKQAEEPPTVHHRLPGPSWLDYAVNLGCNGLALGPVFASQTHGYDTVDFFTIDPRLGDDRDFDRLVEAARERGIRILLDGVFNHVGRAHPRFVDAMEQGPGSDAAAWFHLREEHGTVTARNFEGHDQLVTLNHSHPAVRDHVVEVMCHWLERGADGWRLDAAYAVPPDFWRAVLPRVRERYPDAWFVGEVIHGDYVSYLQESTLNSVTQYELWKAIWSSLNDRNLYELDWTLRRHSDFLRQFLPMTFVGNHDVTRLASTLKDPGHLPHAYALLFFLGGTPSVYYGDEQAFTGVKEERFGGDDAIRPAFPEGPENLAVEGWPTYHLHQRLIALRRRHSWLARATTEVVHLANEQLALASSSPDGSTRLVLLLNLASEEATLPIEVAEVLEQSDGGRAEHGVVAPYGWAVGSMDPSARS
ncbi:MAG TPA: alpha-amylase family glycosyl hydrolase [Propionibacteriaceae bacterium]|nr:alpha-amylase family glycosyl hydrolase [Propionibacteriaceae bacterium]